MSGEYNKAPSSKRIRTEPAVTRASVCLKRNKNLEIARKSKKFTNVTFLIGENKTEYKTIKNNLAIHSKYFELSNKFDDILKV